MTEKYSNEFTAKLGFGFIQLPKKMITFDMNFVKKTVDDFIAEGFTYFDPAYPRTLKRQFGL